MILSGGIVGSVLLLLVAFAAIHFKYKREQPIASGILYNITLWVSIIAIVAVALYGLIKLL
jgi:manganese transport protein